MYNDENLVSKYSVLSHHESDFQPDINIALAIDKNYLKPCGVTIYSVCENNTNLKIDFHIFTTYFSPEGYDEIIKKNPNIRIHIYLLNSSYFDKLQVNGHFTTAIYYRLSIANILKNKVEKFLYIDADILCVRSLRDIINIDLQDKVLAAAPDYCMKKDYLSELHLNKDHQYFNSGVLLINTKAWLDFNVIEKFQELITKRMYKFPDQDVLNILLQNNIYYLNEKFNFFSKNTEIDPVLIHFVSSPKPWSIAAIHGEDYRQYYYQSPWKNHPLNPPRDSKEAKKYAKILWKKAEYLQSLKWFFAYAFRKITK